MDSVYFGVSRSPSARNEGHLGLVYSAQFGLQVLRKLLKPYASLQ